MGSLDGMNLCNLRGLGGLGGLYSLYSLHSLNSGHSTVGANTGHPLLNNLLRGVSNTERSVRECGCVKPKRNSRSSIHSLRERQGNHLYGKAGLECGILARAVNKLVSVSYGTRDMCYVGIARNLQTLTLAMAVTWKGG